MQLEANNVLTTARKNLHAGRLVRYAGSGVVATGAMTLFMGAAKASGHLRKPPPKHITVRAAQRIGLKPHKAPQQAVTAAWLAAHVGYGMASGVVYGILRGVLPRSAWVSGLIYGGGLWAISYLGLMPALGLYPFPNEDYNSRVVAMIAAHGVYGVTLSHTAE